MRRQVPHDAHVRLVEPEIHPARRDEEQLPQRARDDQVVNRHDRRAVEERMAGHDDEAELSGSGRELGGVAR